LCYIDFLVSVEPGVRLFLREYIEAIDVRQQNLSAERLIVKAVACKEVRDFLAVATHFVSPASV
jgi:hypothetical protein